MRPSTALIADGSSLTRLPPPATAINFVSCATSQGGHYTKKLAAGDVLQTFRLSRQFPACFLRASCR